MRIGYSNTYSVTSDLDLEVAIPLRVHVNARLHGLFDPLPGPNHPVLVHVLAHVLPHAGRDPRRDIRLRARSSHDRH